MRRPLHTHDHGDRRPPCVGRVWPGGFALICLAALIVTTILAVWLLSSFDWSHALAPQVHWADLIDFIAPTAKQAREAGWVSIAEGL